jgi:hypothetical protein
MAWITPTDVNPGDAILASLYNQDVVANGTELAPFFAAWTAWTPTVTSSSGTLTTVTVQVARYNKVGSFAWVKFAVIIDNAGSGGGALRISLPSGIAPTDQATEIGVFRDTAISGNIGAIIIDGSNRLELNQYDNSSPIATGRRIAGSICYETSP